MEVRSRQQSSKGPTRMFTGDVWIDALVGDGDYQRMRVSLVRFSPGARTAWHSHPRGQTLYIVEGRGLVQSRGGQVVEVRAGDVVHTPPGEEHWHGAAPDRFMAHIAMWEVDDAGTGAVWGPHVTDVEYHGQAPAG